MVVLKSNKIHNIQLLIISLLLLWEPNGIYRNLLLVLISSVSTALLSYLDALQQSGLSAAQRKKIGEFLMQAPWYFSFFLCSSYCLGNKLHWLLNSSKYFVDSFGIYFSYLVRVLGICLFAEVSEQKKKRLKPDPEIPRFTPNRLLDHANLKGEQVILCLLKSNGP